MKTTTLLVALCAFPLSAQITPNPNPPEAGQTVEICGFSPNSGVVVEVINPSGSTTEAHNADSSGCISFDVPDNATVLNLTKGGPWHQWPVTPAWPRTLTGRDIPPLPFGWNGGLLVIVEEYCDYQDLDIEGDDFISGDTFSPGAGQVLSRTVHNVGLTQVADLVVGDISIGAVDGECWDAPPHVSCEFAITVHIKVFETGRAWDGTMPNVTFDPPGWTSPGPSGPVSVEARDPANPNTSVGHYEFEVVRLPGCGGSFSETWTATHCGLALAAYPFGLPTTGNDLWIAGGCDGCDT